MAFFWLSFYLALCFQFYMIEAVVTTQQHYVALVDCQSHSQMTTATVAVFASRLLALAGWFFSGSVSLPILLCLDVIALGLL